MIDHAVLIVVDVQNDFLPGGALAVPDGDAVVAPINALVERFAHVVMTQDWHPPGHVSFASTHSGRAPSETIDVDGGRSQTLWPDHCLRGTRGAALAPGLNLAQAEMILRKGTPRHLDSYSAFVEADGVTRTGLGGYLRERGLTTVVVAGLAEDFCVGWTAIDAARGGFETLLVEDATRAIGADGSLRRMRAAMAQTGVKRVAAADLGV